MYKKNLFKKSLAVGIIVLFIGAGAATGINGKINRNDIDEKTLSTLSNQNVCSLNFHIFDKTEEKQNNVNLPIDVANKIYETLEELKYLIAHEPRSDETQNLKIEFVDLLDSYGLIPASLSKNYVLSLLNPSWLKNKQKTPKTRTILSKNYISPVVEKIVNLQQYFKNSFGKTVLNIFDKNTFISPLGKTTATASFCSISSVGEGTTLPIFLLPRPRAIAAWTALGALTSVGELLAPKGFIAEGAQSGSMLGFTGLGLTFSFPSEIFYGFVGYALYTKVSADNIEFYPPNREPVISDENPSNGAEDIPLSLSKLSFRISDADGDLMDYTVTTEPNIGSGSGSNKKNGVYTVPISGLESITKYTWYVVVNDEQSTVENTFSFKTEFVSPVVSDPLPEDGDTWIPIDISELSFKLKDFQGDLMDYTVETSPNIGSSSGYDVGDGTYTCDVNGLNYQTEYTWYVNVTDGTYWTREIFNFFTELKLVFNPYDEGWQYRKMITIDHTEVAGDLINFPVLISVVDPDLRDKAQDDGDDILFMDGSGVAKRLYHEIELFDGSSGELVAWVKIPSLSSSVDTIFYMYYSNPDCINQECPKFVWDSNYVMVQHMKDSLNNSQIQDSTYYDNDGVKKGIDEPLEKESKIGKGQYFDGNDYIDISYSKWYPELGGMNALTLEAWVKPDSTSGHYHEVISAYRPTNMYYFSFGGWDHDQWVIKICSSSSCTSSYFGPENPATGIWYYVVCSWDGNNVSYFLDGNYEVGQYWNDGSINSGNQLIRIGAENSDYGEYLIGEISELRISNKGRNSSWIKTSYENQNSSSSFLSIGPEESSP
jgi:hypothetical protein